MSGSRCVAASLSPSPPGENHQALLQRLTCCRSNRQLLLPLLLLLAFVKFHSPFGSDSSHAAALLNFYFEREKQLGSTPRRLLIYIIQLHSERERGREADKHTVSARLKSHHLPDRWSLFAQLHIAYAIQGPANLIHSPLSRDIPMVNLTSFQGTKRF